MGGSRCGGGGFGLFRSATSPKKPSPSDPPFLASTAAAHCFPKMGLVGGGAPRGNGGREGSFFSLLFSLHLSRVASAIYSIQYPTKAAGMLFFLFAFLFFCAVSFLPRTKFSRYQIYSLSRECKGGEDTTFRPFQVLCAEESYCGESRKWKSGVAKKNKRVERGGKMPMEILPHILAGKKEMGKRCLGHKGSFFNAMPLNARGKEDPKDIPTSSQKGFN